MAVTSLFIGNSLIYSLASLYLLWCLLSKTPIRTWAVWWSLLLGLCIHGYLLYPNIFTQGGLNFNLFNILSLTSWFLLLFFLLFSCYRPIITLATLAAPTALMGTCAGFLGTAPYDPLTNITTGIEAHIVLSIAAYSILLMSAVQAVILRLQIRELKHESTNRLWVSKLPSLVSMEKLLFDMLLVGFILLSIALLLGLIYVENFLTQHLAHKAFFSLLSWMVFAYLIFGHWRFGWRGKRAANFAIYGYLLLAIGFVGSKMVLELLIG